MYYISREAAIGAIENTDWYHINHSGELVHGANSNDDTPLYKADDVYKAIDAVPAADVVERKTGKWISDTDDEPVVIKDGFPDKSCYCSECREWLVASDEYAVKGNFCPNCGADMRGEGHE